MQDCDVVILAGGFGSRLKNEIVNEIPKPMVEINGKPLRVANNILSRKWI